MVRRSRQITETSHSAGARKHGADGPQEDSQIETQRPLVDILQIESHPGIKIGVAPSAHLP